MASDLAILSHPSFLRLSEILWGSMFHSAPARVVIKPRFGGFHEAMQGVVEAARAAGAGRILIVSPTGRHGAWQQALGAGPTYLSPPKLNRLLAAGEAPEADAVIVDEVHGGEMRNIAPYAANAGVRAVIVVDEIGINPTQTALLSAGRYPVEVLAMQGTGGAKPLTLALTPMAA